MTTFFSVAVAAYWCPRRNHSSRTGLGLNMDVGGPLILIRSRALIMKFHSYREVCFELIVNRICSLTSRLSIWCNRRSLDQPKPQRFLFFVKKCYFIPQISPLVDDVIFFIASFETSLHFSFSYIIRRTFLIAAFTSPASRSS